MSNLVTKRLLLRNQLAELRRLAGWVESWAKHEVSDELLFAVQLCLEEVVANIMMHGVAADDRIEIIVELERKDHLLVARIEDNGQQFDPTEFPAPAVAESLTTAKVGDLGIHLARSFAGEMNYQRRGGRNHLTLCFRERCRE
jgi:serine/threonine-protein kinase RsbW